MLVDGMCCDPAELSQVEYVTTHHPKVAVVLLCASQTPEFLINSMRAGVREVLPSPASPSALESAVSRVEAKMKGVLARSPGKILAFLPCKGGSGATFMASNLGYQLAQSASVLLIDLNLQFGDALSFVHDGKPASNLAGVAHAISRLDASFLAASTVKVSSNFSVLAAPDDLTQAMEIKPEHIDAILTVAVNLYDFILLDLSRNLDTLTIKALDRAYRVYPVLQANLPAIRNASKLQDVFKSLGYGADKVEFIVNRFERSGEISLDDLRRSLARAPVRTVPNSFREVNACINHGTALLTESRTSAVARSLGEWADALAPRADEARGLLDRLFKRA
jgi:pilus assembly protein CpaE